MSSYQVARQYPPDSSFNVAETLPSSKINVSGYERLIKILSLYCLTLRQAWQEELLEYLFRECEEPEKLKKLFLDLSPFSKSNSDSGFAPCTTDCDV